MKVELFNDQAVELADIFRMLSDANRLRIAVICLGGPKCVSDIAEQTGLPPALASHHLRLLKAARFVSSKRNGKQVFYNIVDERIRCVITDMVAHVQHPQNLSAEKSSSDSSRTKSRRVHSAGS